VFDHVFLICSQLRSDVILGCDFAWEFGLIFDFSTRCIRYGRDGEARCIKFDQNVEVEASGIGQVEGASPHEDEEYDKPSYCSETADTHTVYPATFLQPDCASSHSCNSVTDPSAYLESVDNKFGEFYLSEVDDVRRNTRSINKVSRSNEIEVVDVIEQSLLEYEESPLCVNAIDSLGNRHFIGREVRERGTPGDSLFCHNGKQELGSAVPDPRAITEAEISHLVKVNENLVKMKSTS
jgi:hypothetical protein